MICPIDCDFVIVFQDVILYIIVEEEISKLT